MLMKKLFLPFVVIVLILGACGSSEEESEAEVDAAVEDEQENQSNGTQDEDELDDSGDSSDLSSEIDDESYAEINSILQHFEDNGFEVEEENVLMAEMVEAKAGLRVNLNDEIVEIYLYDDGSEALEEIKETGTLLDFRTIYKGNIAIVVYSHDYAEEIEDTLDSY